MVKNTDTPKKLKGVRTRSLKRVTNISSMTTLTDMNDDCLTSVFDFLDPISLVKLTKTSERLKQIVTDRVIPLKTVKFHETRTQLSTHKVFKLFGGSITRLSIDANDIQITQPGNSRFSEFLRLLVLHGTPGKLQQLELTGFVDDLQHPKLSDELLQAAAPYLENVHTLTVDIPEDPYTKHDFFNAFITHMPKNNLRNLYLHKIRMIGGWLSVESLPNLRNFHLCMGCIYFFDNDRTNTEQLKRYIRECPQLTTFDYDGRNLEAILIEVSCYIPNLARIGTIKNLMVDESVDQNNNNNIKWNGQNSYHTKWKFLSAFTNFTNLKHFSLESKAQNFVNCGQIFRILANRNTVEHLELYSEFTHQNGNDPIEIEHLRQMSNVKTLRLVDFGRHHTNEFVSQLFGNLIGLRKCSIEGVQIKQAPIIDLVQNSRNLRELNMKTLSSKFYRKLVKVRKLTHSDLDHQPLIIHVPKHVADNCNEDLTSRTYKPNIIAIKSTQ